MHDSLSEQLKQYCDNLIGEPSKNLQKLNKDAHKKRRNVGKWEDFVPETNEDPDSKKSKCLNNPTSSQSLTHERIFRQERRKKKKSKHIKKESQDAGIPLQLNPEALDQEPAVTDDGFKIVDSIPSDDSDALDAFELSSDEELASNEPKVVESKKSFTSDGFKVVSHIPSDESDASDAFESDVDEEEWLEDARTKQLKDDEISEIKEKLGDTSQNMKNASFQSKALTKLIQEFNLDQFVPSTSDRTDKVNSSKNCTLASRLKPPPSVTVVDYSQSRGKKRKNAKKDETFQEESDKIKAEKYLKKARYEVYKLGISKCDKTKKREAKIALAVRLGAKPPKNEAVNYKVLQQQKIEEHKKEKEERETRRNVGMLVNKKTNRDGTKKRSNTKAQSGKFKDGVLTLSKRDIKRINSSK